MAEAHKINFYPKPVPPAKPKVKSFEEIQRLLAQAPPPLRHKHQSIMDPRKLPFNALIVGPTNSGKNTVSSEPAAGPL